MVSMQLVVAKTFWSLEVIDNARATRRSASSPPAQQPDCGENRHCLNEAGPCWKEWARRQPQEDLSNTQAIQAESVCRRAGAECELFTAERNYCFGLEAQRSELQREKEPTRASLTGDIQHALEFNGPAFYAATADGVTQLLRPSPLVASFNNPVDGARSACILAGACLPQPLDSPVLCQRDATTQVGVFQDNAFHTSAAKPAPATGALWHAPDVDELFVVKEKLRRALSTTRKASVKPVRHIPDVEELSVLKNKLCQALAAWPKSRASFSPAAL